MSDDIFSALMRYNQAKPENYLTESLIFVVKALLTNERQLGVEFLNHLCGDDSFFDSINDISISTQERTEQGTPDIMLEALDKLVYIEVKDNSPIDVDQLCRYKDVLASRTAKTKNLILLTRATTDQSEHRNIPDRHVRWFEVYNWLDKLLVKDAVDKHLVDSFKAFLRRKNMSIEKVEWEYIKGVPALNNLMAMIEVAIKKLPATTSWGTAKGYMGFYFQNGKYWCGVGYGEPLELKFEVCQNVKKEAVKSVYPTSEADSGSLFILLNLEKIHFFSLNKDEQLVAIETFMRQAYSDSQAMTKKLSPKKKPQ